ncbi:DUF1080 domain-containing protein [soil metagenome]
MSKPFLFFVFIFLISSCARKKENTHEWTPLFNGTDIDNWTVKIHHHDVGINFGNTFRVQDSIIRVVYDQYGEFNDQFGHLYYKKPFSNFHLKLEYRFVGELQRGAPDYTLRNSGVMFHSQDPRTMPKEQNWPISVEMQFLGGLGDGNPRPTGNMCSPGTEIFFNGSLYPSHCLNSTSKTYDGDQWVKAELIVYGDSLVTHLINGDTVLRYTKPQMGGGVVNGYDSTLWKPGQLLSSGFIALQSEGQPVDFKRILIKELKTNQNP